MSAVGLSLVSVAVSMCALIVLAALDPERMRVRSRAFNVDMPMPPMIASHRRALAAAVLMPGVALALAGEWVAFLIWAGASLIGGWGLALSMRAA